MIKLTLGEKVRHLRQTLNLTQEDLSQQSGVTQATISRLENDTQVSINSQTLRTLARALKTSIDFLLNIEKNAYESGELRLLGRDFQTLGPGDKQIVHEFVHFLRARRSDKRRSPQKVKKNG